MSEKIPLDQARKWANSIVGWLSPFCARIEVVGSIRRGRVLVGDIDLLCIPKGEVDRDLYGNVVGQRNHLHEELKRYVAEKAGAAKFVSGENKVGGVQFIVQLPKCQLDLFMATEATWGSRMVCRTGSTAHNMWLVQRAKELGGKWEPYWGVTLPGKLPVGDTEERIFEALGMRWIKPEERER